MWIYWTTPKRWNPVSPIIRLMEKTPWSHCMLVFKLKNGKMKVFQANFSGIHVMDLEDFLLEHKVMDSHKYELTHEEQDCLLSVILDLVGKSYGYLTIIGNLFNRLMPFIRRPILADGTKTFKCGELIVFTLKKVKNIRMRYKESDGPKKVWEEAKGKAYVQ